MIENDTNLDKNIEHIKETLKSLDEDLEQEGIEMNNERMEKALGAIVKSRDEGKEEEEIQSEIHIE